MVDIDKSQFGFVPGRGSTDSIFTVLQLQNKYRDVKKPVYFCFVDLEKAFDRVHKAVVCWAVREFGVEEWAVCTVQGLYSSARNQVCVNGQLSKEFEVMIGVHQASVLLIFFL